ncbi:4-(cytidine 5'-diphospho)-2-C-methyl-D-erythritol kinase [Microbacterium sp. No. 7]|uniref:4-(cytidine 5'-diphospho)-2-C-methyl-D-erythritol kinase n=1 Tax=Microbacterium sp. No. 7 TaxID=1714373 RepID=UPI0006D0AE32|nr:4-(cytidine 5'-diphospho)-2-C-methyl-D-erythritol kinase [Microbacterium sp. No. 7]ALJ19765.1 4-diphosphocytidyl-2C-methyl-D-erythritol kinase [Microbacterium sp. No. 7]
MSLARAFADRVHARAPGKINVSLDVGPRKDDGYHDLVSVFLAVSLYEDVVVSHSDGFSARITGDIDVAGVPVDETNLAVRAARLVVEEAGWNGGVHLDIHKRVPVAGGMGGGSADAAAALVAVDDLLHAGLGAPRLHRLAARLGADVPFALHGGAAVGVGRGDELTPALTGGRFDWALVSHPQGLSTPAVYREFDRLREGDDAAACGSTAAGDTAVLQALRAGDPRALAAAVFNGLQPAALSLRPDLGAVLVDGVERGALAGIVSGSGPTLAFLAGGESDARALAASLVTAGHDARHVHGPVHGAHIVSRAG